MGLSRDGAETTGAWGDLWRKSEGFVEKLEEDAKERLKQKGSPDEWRGTLSW